ncbi:hypothetical protein CVT26_001117 [Gymnopilus dilepis]|uniref:Uncharacterized protein n=1 Tax=Gymnopilus dilepis TaxID=231916 RepID=A0A409W7H2_9AGAR|nr:hypothetical protein CVT26_001117 [Gymnopilus dilepis]
MPLLSEPDKAPSTATQLQAPASNCPSLPDDDRRHEAKQNANPGSGSARIKIRPATIAELQKEASLTSCWDEKRDFLGSVMLASWYWQDGIECVALGRLERAFVQLSRAATMSLEKLPNHKDYKKLKAAEKQALLVVRRLFLLVGIGEMTDELPLMNCGNERQNGLDMLSLLGEIQTILTQRYSEWLRNHFLADVQALPVSVPQRVPLMATQVRPRIANASPVVYPVALNPHVHPLPFPPLQMKPSARGPFYTLSRSAPSSTTNVNQYTLPPSRTDSTDYGIYCRRMAYSQETSFVEALPA